MIDSESESVYYEVTYSVEDLQDRCRDHDDFGEALRSAQECTLEPGSTTHYVYKVERRRVATVIPRGE